MAAASARGVALDDPDALFAPLDAQRATPLPAERGASLTRAGLLAAGCAESAADIRTLDLTAFAPSVRWASWLAECRGLRALKAHFPQDAAQVVSEIEQQCDLRDLRAFRAAGSGLRTLRALPFPALETLELRHCMFRALPDLRALRKLSQLALVGCDLRQIPEGALPLSLARLDVSSNRLESLAFAAGLPSLKTLAAGENCLAKLPSSLGALTQLRDLDLADNKLCDAADLTPLAALPALTVLDLSGNGLTSCVGFPAIAALEELSLAGNRLASPEGLARACPQLESLDLDGNPISALAPLAREGAVRTQDASSRVAGHSHALRVRSGDARQARRAARGDRLSQLL
jgi:Leucine-rich repeat (LRR) protein